MFQKYQLRFGDRCITPYSTKDHTQTEGLVRALFVFRMGHSLSLLCHSSFCQPLLSNSSHRCFSEVLCFQWPRNSNLGRNQTLDLGAWRKPNIRDTTSVNKLCLRRENDVSHVETLNYSKFVLWTLLCSPIRISVSEETNSVWALLCIQSSQPLNSSLTTRQMPS